jgi:uncharacterized protein (DUF2236 family)
MSAPLPPVREIPGFLGLPLVGGDLEFPADAPRAADSPDAGYFGPDSVTWRIMREPLIGLGGPRALLMQAAHPLVAAGARQHSFYAEDPWKRLKETGQWVARVVYGTRAQADWAIRGLNHAHHHVTGELEPENATERVPANTPYRAMQSELLRWVHATMLDSLLVTYEALVGRVSDADADRFVQEWNPIARRVGVRPEHTFHSRAQLRTYIDDEIERGAVGVGEGSRIVAETIFRPPLDHIQPAWNRMLVFPLGLLPDSLRRQYGVRWTALHRLEFRAEVAGLRRARQAASIGAAVVPGGEQLRFSDAYRRAAARAAKAPVAELEVA